MLGRHPQNVRYDKKKEDNLRYSKIRKMFLRILLRYKVSLNQKIKRPADVIEAANAAVRVPPGTATMKC